MVVEELSDLRGFVTPRLAPPHPRTLIELVHASSQNPALDLMDCFCTGTKVPKVPDPPSLFAKLEGYMYATPLCIVENRVAGVDYTSIY